MPSKNSIAEFLAVSALSIRTYVWAEVSICNGLAGLVVPIPTLFPSCNTRGYSDVSSFLNCNWESEPLTTLNIFHSSPLVWVVSNDK